MKMSIRLSLISRLVFFVSSLYPQALNSNNPPWGLIRKGGLFVKSNFRGVGLFESEGLIDHLRYLEHLKFFVKSTPRNTFFTEQLPVAAFRWQLYFFIFFKREKQKQIFIPRLTLIRLKFCNCFKIKSFSFMILKKTTRIYLPIFSI